MLRSLMLQDLAIRCCLQSVCIGIIDRT